MTDHLDEHLDDDENVKAMRETARTIGLTQLIIDANRDVGGDIRLAEALGLLGVSETERKAS